MQVEGRRRDAVELLEATFSETPEALDAIDVMCAGHKLVPAVMDSKMPGVSDIDQPVVAAPTVAVGDRVERDSAAHNGL